MKAVGGTLPLVPLCKLFAGVIALLWRLVVDPAARVVLYGAHAVRHASPLVLPVLSAHSHAVARAGGHLRRHAARHPLSRSVALAVLATAAGRATLEHNEGLRARPLLRGDGAHLEPHALAVLLFLSAAPACDAIILFI